ncbi:MAG TPA: hypothetical protein VIC08_00780 [Cellvibrionaceae bacterium]
MKLTLEERARLLCGARKLAHNGLDNHQVYTCLFDVEEMVAVTDCVMMGANPDSNIADLDQMLAYIKAR